MSHRTLLENIIANRSVKVYRHKGDIGLVFTLDADKLVSYSFDEATRTWNKHRNVSPLSLLTQGFIAYTPNFTTTENINEECVDEVIEMPLMVSDRQFIKDLLQYTSMKCTLGELKGLIGLSPDGFFYFEPELTEQQKYLKAFMEKEKVYWSFAIQVRQAKSLLRGETLMVQEHGTDVIYAFQLVNDQLRTFKFKLEQAEPMDGEWIRTDEKTAYDLLTMPIGRHMTIPPITTYRHAGGMPMISPTSNLNDNKVLALYGREKRVVYQTLESLTFIRDQQAVIKCHNWLGYKPVTDFHILAKKDMDVLSQLDKVKLQMLLEEHIDVVNLSEAEIVERFEYFFKLCSNKRYREVIFGHYGLGGSSVKTYREIGEVLSVSKERVRQVKALAFRQLRHPTRMKIMTHGIPKPPKQAQCPVRQLTEIHILMHQLDGIAKSAPCNISNLESQQ